MMSIDCRKMTKEEHAQGYMICECGKYAFVFRASVLLRLPVGYDGEICPDCRLWMVAIDKLKAGE